MVGRRSYITNIRTSREESSDLKTPQISASQFRQDCHETALVAVQYKQGQTGFETGCS